MLVNNKKRLLKLIEILRKYSNEDRHLKLDEIISLLETNEIAVSNRKTLYDDFKMLNECGFDIEYDNGYYLLEAPFSLSEIKIIQDSIYSLKNLDTNLLNNLNNKLYSFVSYDDEKLLERLKYQNKHKDKKLLQKMEDVLFAIKNNCAISIKKSDKKEIVFPVFIHRENDYYYFYYHYLDSDKLYHYRFDNIQSISINNLKDNINIPKNIILDTINASSNSFYSLKAELVNIVVLNSKSFVDEHFLDDFPNAIKTKDGYSLKVSVNNNLFGKLAIYGDNIKISDKDIANRYKKYLQTIINNY